MEVKASCSLFTIGINCSIPWFPAIFSSAVQLFLSNGSTSCVYYVIDESVRVAVLENRILPSLYRSRKHSEKDVSSVVIHCRKFFSHFPHIWFGRITHNASLPDRWLQQVILTFDQAAQPESSAVLSCYGWTSWIQVQPQLGLNFLEHNRTKCHLICIQQVAGK